MSVPLPGRFTPGKQTRYPLSMRLVGPKGQSGRVWKISPPPGFDPWTVQPIVSLCTEYANLANMVVVECQFYDECHRFHFHDMLHNPAGDHWPYHNVVALEELVSFMPFHFLNYHATEIFVIVFNTPYWYYDGSSLYSPSSVTYTYMT
jgi:hypothetical protein